MPIADITVNLTAVIVALMGGGFITGLIALLKYKPEKDAIVVSAAKGAVVVQSGVIDALQEELDRARADSALARKEIQEVRNEFREEVVSLKLELAAVRRERDGLRRLVERYEEENVALRERVAKLESVR